MLVFIFNEFHEHLFFSFLSRTYFSQICSFTFVIRHIYRFIAQLYYINNTFPAWVIVENITPRNVIINRGAAEVEYHPSRDDIFDYHPRIGM